MKSDVIDCNREKICRKCFLTTRDAEAGSGSGKFLWKPKLEAVKGYCFHFAILIERQNVNVVQVFLKYTVPRKVGILSIITCKEKFLKACGSLKSGAVRIPTNSNMNHVADQIIYKITVCGFKFLNFSPKI